MKLRRPASNWALTGAIALLALIYWASALSFAPVPWPDDSAFFLTGLEWIRWPSLYRMHSQAPFVPTYDLANFNTMPLMPLILGIGAQLGLDSSHAIRIYGMSAYAGFALGLAAWMRHRKISELWVWLVSLAAILSPAIRWGAMVVRPEIWEAWFWLLIVMDLDGFFKRPNAWRIPAILAVAAGVHFEAIVWVIPTTIAVALASPSLKEAWRRLLSIAWRTTVLLTPWILYVLANWSVFWIQMETQFGRLEAHHPYLQGWYGVFHNLFLSLGNPVSYPKFFNLGKIITWGAMLVGAGRVSWLASRTREDRGLRLASLAALAATWYLWTTKPETWFTAMIHTSLWTMLVLALPRAAETRWPSKLAAAPIALLLVLQAGVAVDQWLNLRKTFTWRNYEDWVSCIDQTLGDRVKIWQPHWPDVLVELSGRKPHRDYTRAVDFPNIDLLIDAHAKGSDAIIHSLYFAPNDGISQLDYQGEPRELDRYHLTEYPWIPFKNYSALHLGKDWSLSICHKGPFWAGISLRKSQ